MTDGEAREIIIEERDSLKADPKVEVEDCLYEAFDFAIKALEREDVLNKIRSEIASIAIHGQVDEHTMFIRSGEQVKQAVLDIIDKYNLESEDKE